VDIESAKEVLIVIPTYNEESLIEKNIVKLRNFLLLNFNQGWRIIVADNASNDETVNKVKELSEKYPDVTWFHINQAGKGRAIKKAIMENEADIILFMDADLSTDLSAIPLSIDTINDGYDIAIGCRLLEESQVERAFRRELLSRGYNLLLKLLFRVNFSDAQCGFKALRRKAIIGLLPKVKDDGWFFDTELLIYSKQKGLKIKELPIKWRERKESKLPIFKIVFQYGFSLCKLRLRLLNERV